MYQVEFTTRAAKELAALERGLQMRVVKKLEAAAKDPARFFMHLKGVEGFRLRVGDLRVLAVILSDEKVILVATIGKREGVYKS